MTKAPVSARRLKSGEIAITVRVSPALWRRLRHMVAEGGYYGVCDMIAAEINMTELDCAPAPSFPLPDPYGDGIPF